MIQVALVRGKYLNNFEGQNYRFGNDIKITGVSSYHALHDSFAFPVIRLRSLADLVSPVTKFAANRIIGDMHILYGLEKLAPKFDLFHTADSHYYFSYQLARLRKAKKIKHLISTSWETIPFNNETVGKKKSIKLFTMSQIDKFITYSKKAKESLLLEGIAEKKITQIYLGVNLWQFFPRVRRSSSSKKTVLFVGRDVPEKGLDDLRQVIQKISSKKIILSSITTAVPYEKMPEIYRTADIIVVPSRRTKTWEEQYGMVLIEAMASGLPIIAYNTGVIHEVVGDAGIVIPPTQQNLFRALNRLISDDRLCLEFAKKARSRAEEKYDATKTASQIGRIYHELTKTDRHRSHKK